MYSTCIGNPVSALRGALLPTALDISPQGTRVTRRHASRSRLAQRQPADVRRRGLPSQDVRKAQLVKPGGARERNRRALDQRSGNGVLRRYAEQGPPAAIPCESRRSPEETRRPARPRRHQGADEVARSPMPPATNLASLRAGAARGRGARGRRGVCGGRLCACTPRPRRQRAAAGRHRA